MATLSVRKLSEATKQALRERAARANLSMERAAAERLVRSATRSRKRKATVEEILALGIPPSEPFDLKKVSDEMWDEGLL